MSMNRYYIGGDVSKGYCDFVILDNDKQIIEPNFQLDDTAQGHRKLSEILAKIRSRAPHAAIYVGLESTGGYEDNWYQLLWGLKDRLDLQVTRLNPLAVKHHKIASMERIETDAISAKKIADYLIAYPEVPTYNHEDPLASVRKQWKFIRLLKNQKAQLKKVLESLLYKAHPEMLKYWNENLGEWFLEVLIRYPTAKVLSNATVKELSEIPYVSKQRARELICNAQNSVASAVKSRMERVISELARQIMNSKIIIKELVEEMLESYEFPEIEILTSFKGIGEFSAFGLMVEIVSVERFPSAKKLASHFGVNPVFKKSGDGEKMVPRMSKQGRKEPRWILYNVTLSAITCNPMIKGLYEGYVKAGKKKMVAIGILMHKILRIVYGMLKHRTKFDPQIDLANRNEKKNPQRSELKPGSEKDRRYQPYDPDAPVSQRQAKKRKKHEDALKETAAQKGTPDQKE